MFYCKDVKYDMCELKKKIMIRKIKYAKNLNDWIFFFPHQSCCQFHCVFTACRKRKTSRTVYCCAHKTLAAGENFFFKRALTCRPLNTLRFIVGTTCLGVTTSRRQKGPSAELSFSSVHFC